jgi:hypothetical protein
MPVDISKEEAKKMGIPKRSLQTILFNKSAFNITTSKTWLKKHNYANSYYRKTTNQLRYMQTPAILDADYYAKKITPDITLIFQEY